MSNICITGAEIVTPFEIFKGSVQLEEGLITKLSDTVPAKSRAVQVVDGRGCYLTPGLIDLQVNGSAVCNLWDKPTAGQFGDLRAQLLAAGTTSFLPTLITDEIAKLGKGIAFLAAHGVKESQSGLNLSASRGAGRCGADGRGVDRASKLVRQPLACVPGIHLEGPFISPEKYGVHPLKWVRPISVNAVKELITPQVVLMTLAPELAGADAAIKFLQKHHVIAALGHSNATFEQANRAFRSGVTLVTHTFNALPPLHHRAPGAVAAAMLNPEVFCSVIADGLHVHPAAIELLLKYKGVKRTVLVSDAAWEGTKHGELVGSSITMADAVKNMVRWKVATFADAIMMASYNAAAVIGLEKKIGHIAPGKKADLLLWDKKSLRLKAVIFRGRLVSGSVG